MSSRLPGLAALAVCLALLGALGAAVQGRDAGPVDAGATAFLHELAGPAPDAAMGAITALGSTFVVGIVVIAALLVLAWERRGADALFLAVAMAGAWGLIEGLKALVARPRPRLDWTDPDTGGSFPSGHVVLVLVLGVSLALVATVSGDHRRRAAGIALAVGLAGLVGISRVYLGQHHLSDVAGGLAAGGAWLLVLGLAFAGRRPLARTAGGDAPVVSGAGAAPR